MSKHIVMRHCITCKLDKPESDFSKYRYTTTAGNPGTRYDSRCKECNRERRRKRYADPVKGEIDRKTSQEWKDNNREHVKKYNKLRCKLPHHKANNAKSQRHRAARIRSGSCNKDPAIKAIYQLTADTEKKLSACVECDDELEIKIHVDHIIPLSRGGKHVIENLQILSAKQNLKKGATIPATPEEVAPLCLSI